MMVDLVSVLERGFANGNDTLTVMEGNDPDAVMKTETYPRPTAELNTPKNTSTTPDGALLTQADIDAALGTQVAPLDVPRQGSDSRTG
jgi:hypothetical protein